MKQKQQNTTARLNFDSMRLSGALEPTTKRNTRRHRSEDRFTLLCMIGAAILSALVVWLES